MSSTLVSFRQGRACSGLPDRVCSDLQIAKEKKTMTCTVILRIPPLPLNTALYPPCPNRHSYADSSTSQLQKHSTSNLSPHPFQTICPFRYSQFVEDPQMCGSLQSVNVWQRNCQEQGWASHSVDSVGVCFWHRQPLGCSATLLLWPRPTSSGNTQIPAASHLQDFITVFLKPLAYCALEMTDADMVSHLKKKWGAGEIAQHLWEDWLLFQRT